MAKSLDPQTKRALADRIAYYRELGIHDFYRREVLGSAGIDDDASLELEMPESKIHYEQLQEPFRVLQSIREDLGDCTRCKLHKQGHKQIVFGVGNPRADIMFIGEGPGADEDEQGEPFVGRAGQLLNNMISAMGIKREDVYIANVVKCRPPGNRTPEPDECATCSPFLLRQIDAIRPKALVALGAVAARTLTGVNEPMIRMRGKWWDFRGTPLAVTYHPAYLLRDPRQKAEAWKDLQMVMNELGLKPPAKK
jgi:uracil-DNA glycosylase